MKAEQTEVIRDRITEQKLPATWSVSEGSLRKTIAVSGTGLFRVETSAFCDFLVSLVTVSTDEPGHCICQGRGRAIGLHFNITGTCVREYPDGRDVITPGQHAIYYSSAYDERLRFIPENGKVQILEVNLPVTYYDGLLSGSSALQDDFLGRIDSDQQGYLQNQKLPITLPMRWIINTISQNRRTGVFKRIFLESKILELLMLQVEQAEGNERLVEDRSLQSTDQEALYEAKAILERNLTDPPTIRNLAKMVGMNEFDLKRRFKQTFNATIYGFVSKAKMQQAKQIL